MPSAVLFDCATVTSAPFGSVRWIHHIPPRLGEYVALVTVQPAGTPAGTSAGKPSAMAALTALLMIGEGTGSPLSVGESLADGESAAEAVSEGVVEALGADDAVGSAAVVSSPSSEPHPAIVTAARASPAMATGIRVMRQVCLVLLTRS